MKNILPLATLLAAMTAMAQDSAKLTVHLDKPTINVSPNLYGIFFEEINHAGDGGIYAELLNNRGFERDTEKDGTILGWRGVSGTVSLDSTNALNAARKRALKIEGKAGSAAINTGFWGIPVQPNQKYKLTVWAKGTTDVAISLEGATGAVAKLGSTWKKYDFTLTGKELTTSAKLQFSTVKDGTAWIGWASLMPEKTWKNHGMRVDLAQKVESMKPTFVRFPGGCYVEGYNFESAFDWKKSLGPLWERPGYTARLWGYPSTDGLGLHEYLQWCEDLKAAPLFVVNCGINHGQVAPMDKMEPFVQDALDAIEYANGPVTSKWGALRAKNGHPKPFNLKYIEIGNENGASWSFGGPEAYAPRYKMIFDAIKKAHPEIITIANNPTTSTMEYIDEHYYTAPGWMWRNSTRYDSYDRSGPKIYVGEYAVTSGCGRGNLAAALGEAAFISGMERNSDIVKMASYAPLFENLNSRQWNPNAILFNNHQSYGTPAYHVQAMFGQNRPDRIVKTEVVSPVEAWENRGGVGLSSWQTDAEYKDLTLVADGKTVFESAGKELSSYGLKDGKWSISDGIIRQAELGNGPLLWTKGVDVAGAKTWTVSVKARKLSGKEGFMVHALDEGDGKYIEWNIGGWGNTKAAFQQCDTGSNERLTEGVPFVVEENRWYDIRIEGNGDRVTGYIDGVLIDTVQVKQIPQFVATAGIDEKTNEVVVKCVNGSKKPQVLDLSFVGGQIVSNGTAIILTGESLLDENSMDAPLKIAPKRTTVNGLGEKGSYTLPARSFTILRIRRK